VIQLTETTKETPDQQLARIIGQALVAENLVASDKQEKLIKELATGNVTGEDWRLYIESAITPEDND